MKFPVIWKPVNSSNCCLFKEDTGFKELKNFEELIPNHGKAVLNMKFLDSHPSHYIFAKTFH